MPNIRNRQDKENKESKFSNLIKSAIGIGALAYAGKKILDLYMESEDDSIISSEEYEEEVEARKSNYIEVNSGRNLEFDSSELFDRTKITEDYNADKLFKLFLDEVEKIIELPDKIFKISDIEKIIPHGKSNIDNKTTYDYSVMSMLGGQSGRDYFIFKNNKNLRDIFTRECNDSNRDNRLWANKYGDEEFIINPKYIKGNEDDMRR